MTFTVTGIGIGGVALRYSEETIERAKYLASKMSDNGVRSVMVLDEAGHVINLTDSYQTSKDHWRSSFRRH